MIKKWFMGTVILAWISLGYAAIDVYEFDNSEQRHRYQQFLEELRCPLCKNSNLAGTNSQIAEDLRRELHRMVLEGQSDEKIIDFMVTRYGDFVLYRPRIQKNTMFLWMGPIAFAVIGALCIGWIVARRRKFVNTTEGLTEEEQNQLASMLSTNDSQNNRK